MSRSYFITATGTDLGKTWLTAGVVAACRAQGQPVRALKPVLSGYDPAHHEDSDSAKLGADRTVIDEVSPWRFAAPLSPDLAAAREGRSIDFAQLVGWCRAEIDASAGLLLIEGIGGAMVPLDARHTVRDWVAALGIPAVLVCGSYLGALSHTLTALAALREVGVVPQFLVINESPASTVNLADTLASLAPHMAGAGADIALLTLRREHAGDLAALAQALLRSA